MSGQDTKKEAMMQSFDSVEEGNGHDDKEAQDDSFSNLIQQNDQLKFFQNLNPKLGYTFMLIAILGLTIAHVFGKMCSFYSTHLSNYDGTFFVGIWVTLIYVPAGIYYKVDLNIFNYKPVSKPAMVLLSCVLAFTINNCILRGISKMSLGEGTLIFCLNPFFCMIFAFFLLKEDVQPINIVSALGAFVGVYFLTQNMKGGTDHRNVLIGMSLLGVAAVCQGAIQIAIKYITIYEIPFLVRPAWIGMTHLLFGILLLIFVPDTVHPWAYDIIDITYLSLSALGVVIFLGAVNVAFMYETASRLTPINYVENVFTLVTDVMMFGYPFVGTDFVGIFIIVV